MAGNSNLHDSMKQKQDEFYTQLPMIENELRHYKEHFKDKIILCNCDDPFESDFFKYFALNFRRLGIKKLLATGYSTSPIIGKELNVWTGEETEIKARTPYSAYINEMGDLNHDGRIDLEDVKIILKEKKNCRRRLYGDDEYPAGDFRSKECIKLLKQADIVVTNPPFSMFREYFSTLINFKKKFLIIGNMNDITFTGILPHFIEKDVWLGASSGHFWFKVPDTYENKKTDFKIDEKGQKWRRMGNICWYTNLDYPERHENMILYKKYDPNVYPFYDGTNIIDVNMTKNIPMDFDGIMGIPVSGADKIHPEQFDFVGKIDSGPIDGYNLANPVINGKVGYKRIAIKRR